jgi:hypothetical protein
MTQLASFGGGRAAAADLLVLLAWFAFGGLLAAVSFQVTTARWSVHSRLGRKALGGTIGALLSVLGAISMSSAIFMAWARPPHGWISDVWMTWPLIAAFGALLLRAAFDLCRWIPRRIAVL